MKYIAAVGMVVFQWYLLWAGLWQHQGWAWNVFRFLMWGFTLLWLMAVISVAQTKKKIAEKRALGSVFPALSDLGVAIVLSAYAHYWYATLAILQLLIEPSLFGKDEPKPVKGGMKHDPNQQQ